MRVVIGGDHAGFSLKGPVIEALRSWGHEVNDVGIHSMEKADFPDIARKVCEAVLSGEAERGIMVCGTGVGATIACNKMPGIRACVGHDVYTAHQCVEHDNVQVLCLGAQIIGERLAFDVLQIFLEAKFNGGEQFARRIAKLAQMERKPGEE
jgi:ribose 5-phosphate isomerase B